MAKILVTGGAGFIGSYLVDQLISAGHQVRVFDNLEKQVHHGKIPKYLNPNAQFTKGDVRDCNALKKSLTGVETVFHLASRVGVGQSNYEVKDYTDVNIGGTANLLDMVLKDKLPIRKIIMIASMTSYGEGNYRCRRCGIVKPGLRDPSQMKKKKWELVCPRCQSIIEPIATVEEAAVNNNSFYAVSKNVQETMLLLAGRLYRIPVTSLRCFNVYGPRQSLSNPYTGVTAIFISRLKNNKSPVLYEDGKQTRDFVSVHDVVGALIAAMEKDAANYQAINIGSGKPTTVKEIAILLAKLLEKKINPDVSEEYRINDIRHCFADISKARKLLSWEPRISLKKGLLELVQWSLGQRADDSFELAEKELRRQSLL